MAKKRRFGVFKQMVNVSGWMGLKNIRSTGENIVKSFKDISEVNITERKETFEEALKRMNLKEEDIKRRMRQCYITGWFYLACASLLFGYAIYLLVNGSFLGCLIALILTTFAGTLAYRESFWYFQMSVRKLGCTFKEYLHYIIRGKA